MIVPFTPSPTCDPNGPDVYYQNGWDPAIHEIRCGVTTPVIDVTIPTHGEQARKVDSTLPTLLGITKLKGYEVFVVSYKGTKYYVPTMRDLK